LTREQWRGPTAMDRNTLFELTPREFEELCAALLKAEGLQNVAFVGGPDDQGVDISAEAYGRRVAVQVKHTKRKLSATEISRIIHRMRSSSYHPDELIIITSSPISPSERDAVQSASADINVRLMGSDEVLQSLNAHPDIRRSRIAPAEQRTKRQRRELTIGIGAALSSVVGVLVSVLSLFVGPDKPALHQRIEAVEIAIGSLKDLENQLKEIKADIVQTDQATKAIQEEYAQAQQLEKLTDEQLQAVKAALQRQSWQRTVLDYFLGFVLGVAASLTASVIYSRVRQWRALAAE